MDILVASTNAHKLAAVREAARTVFPGQELNVRGIKAASDINEQPVGHQETVRGAMNRLQNLKAIAAQTRCDLYVSLENGIFPVNVGDQETWFDVGWVVVEDAAGNKSLSHSTGIEIGHGDVKEAQRRGFDQTTAGSMIAERTGADSTDPHAHLTNGHVPRSEMLKQALMAAFGQHQKKSAKE